MYILSTEQGWPFENVLEAFTQLSLKERVNVDIKKWDVWRCKPKTCYLNVLFRFRQINAWNICHRINTLPFSATVRSSNLQFIYLSKMDLEVVFVIKSKLKHGKTTQNLHFTYFSWKPITIHSDPSNARLNGVRT